MPPVPTPTQLSLPVHSNDLASTLFPIYTPASRGDSKQVLIPVLLARALTFSLGLANGGSWILFSPRCCQWTCLHLKKPSPHLQNKWPYFLCKHELPNSGCTSFIQQLRKLFEESVWPELATSQESWGQGPCHFLWQAVNASPTEVLGCSGNCGNWVCILDFSRPCFIPYNSHPTFSVIPFLLSFFLQHFLAFRYTDILPTSLICFAWTACGWYSITVCSVNDRNAQGLHRQCQGTHTEELGKPGVLVSQLSQSPAA